MKKHYESLIATITQSFLFVIFLEKCEIPDNIFLKIIIVLIALFLEILHLGV